MMDEARFKLDYVEPKYQLFITPGFSIEQVKRPNVFWRFMQYVFLGWVWRENR